MIMVRFICHHSCMHLHIVLCDRGLTILRLRCEEGLAVPPIRDLRRPGEGAAHSAVPTWLRRIRIDMQERIVGRREARGETMPDLRLRGAGRPTKRSSDLWQTASHTTSSQWQHTGIEWSEVSELSRLT